MQHFEHLNDDVVVDPNDSTKTACALGVLLFTFGAPACGLAFDKGDVGFAIGLGAVALLGLGIAMISYLQLPKSK